MASHTIEENIAIIRTDIYGKNVRAAIADAIEQNDDQVDTIKAEMDARELYVQLSRLEGNDYLMTVVNAT